MLRHLSRPIRTVVAWQLAATAGLAALSAVLAGEQGAVSAALGGGISIVAGLPAAVVASRGKAGSAGGVVVGALAAEALKLGLAVILLWLVMANYDAAVVAALIGAFVVTLLIFSMAFFVREH